MNLFEHKEVFVSKEAIGDTLLGRIKYLVEIFCPVLFKVSFSPNSLTKKAESSSDSNWNGWRFANSFFRLFLGEVVSPQR